MIDRQYHTAGMLMLTISLRTDGCILLWISLNQAYLNQFLSKKNVPFLNGPDFCKKLNGAPISVVFTTK